MRFFFCQRSTINYLIFSARCDILRTFNISLEFLAKCCIMVNRVYDTDFVNVFLKLFKHDFDVFQSGFGV